MACRDVLDVRPAHPDQHGRDMTDAEMALREEIMAELLACYGEGENTDWPYLTDLRDLIVTMIEKHSVSGNGVFHDNGNGEGSETSVPADHCWYCGWVEPDQHMGTCPKRAGVGRF